MKIKEGDLITVAQQVSESYRTSGDIAAIVISNEDVPNEMGDVRKLRGKEIYQIVHNDAPEELRQYGVNIGHFTLKGMPILSVSLDDPDFLLVNGEVKIYDVPKGASNLEEKFFFDEGIAETIATHLNTIERDKFKDLRELADKGYNMMCTIVEKGRV